MKTPYTKRWNPLTDPHAPLDWPTPELVEVSDILFAGCTPDPAAFLDRTFATMAIATNHAFVIPTEHAETITNYFTDQTIGHRIYQQVSRWLDHEDGDPLGEGAAWDRAHKLAEWRAEGGAYARWKLPLANVIPAAIIRTQADANERLTHLLRCPASLRAVYLRLRESVDLDPIGCPVCESSENVAHHNGADVPWCNDCDHEAGSFRRWLDPGGIDWVILSGSTGHPLHPDWVRSVRDQCKAASVPFWFSGWGEWMPIYDYERNEPRWNGVPEVGHDDMSRWVNSAGEDGFRGDRRWFMRRTGPAKSGHTLDGRTHHEMPEALAAFAKGGAA